MSEQDYLIISRIEGLRPFLFTFPERLDPVSSGVLLQIVLSIRYPSLPLRSIDLCIQDTYDKSLFTALEKAYASRSFLELMNHPWIVAQGNPVDDRSMVPASPVKGKCDDDKSWFQPHATDARWIGLHKAFQADYQGDLPKYFLRVINRYSERWNIYNKSMSIIQSSGMGKSRLVHEVANQIFTIPANLGVGLPRGKKAYPPVDWPLCSYFEEQKLKSDRLVQAEHAILLKNIFQQTGFKVLTGVKDREESRLPRNWAEYLNDGRTEDSVGENRADFYKKVMDATKDEISKISESVWLDLFSSVPKVSRGRSLTSPSDFNQPERRLELRESVKLNKLFAEMYSSASQMLRVVAPEHPDGHECACLVSFDGAHNLAKVPRVISGFRTLSSFKNLGEVLVELRKLPIFFTFLSTNPDLQLAPRLLGPPLVPPPSPGGRYVIPPFTELSFDIFMAEMFAELYRSKKERSLANACTTEVMSSMGRSLWHTYHKQWKERQISGQETSGDRSEHVLELATQELTARWTTKNTSDAELAALSARIGITFASPLRPFHEAESRQVESHMRVVYAIPEHLEYMRTGSSSEPILAEAAARYLNGVGGSAEITTMGPRILAEICQNEVLVWSEQSQLCGRLLVTIAHDVAVLEYPLEDRLLEDPWVKFHRPVPVISFLRALFAKEHHDTILKATPATDEEGETLEDTFKDAYICFSHFAIAEDCDMLEAEPLRLILFRGAALQANRRDTTIDAMIPIHMGPITGAITTTTTTAINLLFMNRKSPTRFVDRNIVLPNTRQPVISIILELGVEVGEEVPNRFVQINHWDPSETVSTERNLHRDDRRYSFVAYGYGPETYKVVPEAVKKYYDTVMSPNPLSEGFIRYVGEDPWAWTQGPQRKITLSGCRDKRGQLGSLGSGDSVSPSVLDAQDGLKEGEVLYNGKHRSKKVRFSEA